MCWPHPAPEAYGKGTGVSSYPGPGILRAVARAGSCLYVGHMIQSSCQSARDFTWGQWIPAEVVRHSERVLHWAGPTSSHSARCRPVNPFQQEAGKASAGGPSSESSILIQMKAKRPLRGGHSGSSSQQSLTRLGGAGDGLANLVKTSCWLERGRQSLVPSGLGAQQARE